MFTCSQLLSKMVPGFVGGCIQDQADLAFHSFKLVLRNFGLYALMLSSGYPLKIDTSKRNPIDGQARQIRL